MPDSNKGGRFSTRGQHGKGEVTEKAVPTKASGAAKWPPSLNEISKNHPNT
ncbi:hypothetical protein [Paenibacillus sp. y28]|uniref:hypothetical protein n=1 Tax=Paenibacillus sp. y28 TaxID=3129110 RepID=UPI003018E0DE